MNEVTLPTFTYSASSNHEMTKLILLNHKCFTPPPKITRYTVINVVLNHISNVYCIGLPFIKTTQNEHAHTSIYKRSPKHCYHWCMHEGVTTRLHVLRYKQYCTFPLAHS